MPKLVNVLLLVALVAMPMAAASEKPSHSHYAGQQTRDIKSLSPDDIEELRRGGDWGLAKAAELNGLPGPAHLLELKDRIPLTRRQVDRITRLFEDMRAQAITVGERLIHQERALDDLFKSGAPTDEQLREQLQIIAGTRMQLRYIHLATHLRTPEILSGSQISRYNELRGYGSANDPCQNVPAGHDEQMWRQHNGCE